MTTAFLLSYETLEQSTDALRNEIEQKKLNNNGKLDAKETEWLNSKPEIFYKGGFDFLFKDMCDANRKYLTKDPKVIEILDGIHTSDTWYKQLISNNKGNLTQLNFINKVHDKYNQAMKEVNATPPKDRTLKARVVAMNMLLMINDYSKKDIGNFAAFSDSTFKAMHQYQKQYKELYGSQNYSRADCIFGYRTAQQLCKNVGIVPKGATVDDHFDSKKNQAALVVDKMSGYTKKQFVLDGFTVYKSYLSSMLNHMDAKGLTKMDEKLEDAIKKLEVDISIISKTKISDADLDIKIDALVNNIVEYRSWMQFGVSDSNMPKKLAMEVGYLNRFKRLLKNPGSYQSARKDIVAIFTKLDKSTILMNTHGDAYMDLARSEMASSREVYNDNNKMVAPEHNKNIVEARTVGKAIKDIDRLLTSESAKSDGILIKIHTLISDNSSKDPKELRKLIGDLIAEEVKNNSNQYKDLENYIETNGNRWDNFMGGNEIKNMVSMIIDNESHLAQREKDLKKSMDEEYQELLKYEKNGTLDPDQEPRLLALTDIFKTGTIDQNLIRDTLKATEIATMGNMLRDHMFYKVMDGKTDNQKGIIGDYDILSGAGKGLSDKYKNTAIDTTVLLAREILIMAISGGVGALAERALVAAVVRGAQVLNRMRGVVSAGRTAAVVTKSGLSAVEMVGVGVRGGRVTDKLIRGGRVVTAGTETAAMANKIGGIASFLSQGSLVTESSLELARSHKLLVALMKLSRYGVNGAAFHLSSTLMTNMIDGNELSQNMSPKDFAKSIAFIGILSEISSVFRLMLPLKNPAEAARMLNAPQSVAGRTINSGSILGKIGAIGLETTTEVTALLGTSRAVNVLFGEKHEDLSPNEIAHTLAIVLGMKAFHGLVTVKDARRGIVENNGEIIDLKTDLTKETGPTPPESQRTSTTGREKVSVRLTEELEQGKKQKTKQNKPESATTRIWRGKQFNVYKDQIQEATELINNTKPDNLTESILKLRTPNALTKQDIKDIQREIGIKGKDVDGVLGSETLKILSEHLKKIEEGNKTNTKTKVKPQQKTKEKTEKQEKTVEEKLNNSEKIKTEAEANEKLTDVENKIKNESMSEAKVESILEKLDKWYKGLKESLKNSKGIVEKIQTIIQLLVAKIVTAKQVETKAKIKKGEIKIPANKENLTPEALDLSLKANLMQENLPKFGRIAEVLDGRFIGSEWLMSIAGTIPTGIGNLTVTGFQAIQAAVSAYYGFKMNLGGDFQKRSIIRFTKDAVISNIPGVGFIGDMMYKANKYNLKDMIGGYKEVVDNLQKSGVDQAFIDHHIEMYEKISGKKYNPKAAEKGNSTEITAKKTNSIKEEGKIEGAGKITSPNGVIQEGNFKNDKLEGALKKTSPDGTVYEGNFKNDKLEGAGKITSPSGIAYEGNFKNGKIDGALKKTSPGGTVYEGNFKNDKLEGAGKITSPNGVIQEGNFKNDKLEGAGKVTTGSGKVYEGNFKNGDLEGEVEITYSDGMVGYIYLK